MIENYFSDEAIQRFLTLTLAKVRKIVDDDDFANKRNHYIELILDAMLKHPDKWDKHCQINIGWISSSLSSAISDSNDNIQSSELDNLYSLCFRFLFEYFLTDKNDLTREFELARLFALENLDKFDSQCRTQIEFAFRDMPTSILKALINHENINNIIEFNASHEKVEEQKKIWDGELDEKLAQVNLLKENLDTYRNGYNFVGLYQGFDEMHVEKTTEKENILKYLKIFGVLIISPILIELIFILTYLNDFTELNVSLLAISLPVFSLVFIFIYFFRILLTNYKSIKSQILQIELRKTLCRFIQNYVDYSKPIKEKDNKSLEKFENIIFSGIVPGDNDIPSTFDGIEGIAKLIDSLKKGK